MRRIGKIKVLLALIFSLGIIAYGGEDMSLNDNYVKESFENGRLKHLALVFEYNFKKLLDENVIINISNGKQLKGIDGAKMWLQALSKSASYSRHDVEGLEVKKLSNSEIKADIKVRWRGIDPKGNRLKAFVIHHLRLSKNENEGFVRLLEMNIEIVEPFALAK